jgi:hypothetical protein
MKSVTGNDGGATYLGVYLIPNRSPILFSAVVVVNDQEESARHRRGADFEYCQNARSRHSMAFESSGVRSVSWSGTAGLLDMQQGSGA